jgi:hypothetical protein
MALERYIHQEEWASIVRDLKQSESVFGHEAYVTERIAHEILRFVRYTRIRQYNLFTQKRGEDFDKMIETLETMGFDIGSVRRVLENDEFWKMTLELAEE